MHPVLFKVFGFPIHSWSVMLILGFLVAWWLAVKRCTRYGITADQLSSLGITMLLSGIVGARVFWVAQEWKSYSGNWLEMLNVTQGGMTSFGGLFFGIAALIIWCKMARIPSLAALDLIAAPALVAIAIGRVGCFLNGCCYGGPCDLPWAVTVHDESGRTYLGHPAQLYDSAMNLAAALALFWYESRARSASTYRTGTLFGFGLIAYGAARFIYEFFRIGSSSEPVRPGFPLTDAQIVAALMAAVGAIVVWRAARTPALARKPS